VRYNPFQPNKIINPAMFVGRLEEIHKIEQYLFQAKSGNSQNFLIDGERGIGKSSLLHYVSSIATGRISGIKEQRFSFLLLSVDMAGVATQLDIVRAIARELRSALSKNQELKEKAKKVFDFLTNWEVLGVRYHKEAERVDPEDAKDNLVDQLADVALNQSAEFDGILVVIDEADAPPVEADFGEFLKSVTERLTRRGCENVIFGLAGLPSTIAKLRASHESAPRIFTILHLEPLEESECKRAINIGMEVANQKNDQSTAITDDALAMLADLSEGYPHFIQQFAYSAFEVDLDFKIDVDDVVSGAYGENGAIHQLGRKYFSEAYFSKINSDDYRKLLNVMADHGDAWVTRRQLIHESKLKETTINNALTALKQKAIIIVDESRQGYYRLPTRSFAAWINALKSAAAKQSATRSPHLPQASDFISS
jgi:hypothetical protein